MTRIVQATIKLAARTNTGPCGSIELQTYAAVHDSLVASRDDIELSRLGDFRRTATICFQPRTADESRPANLRSADDWLATSAP
jgi:hypothetical protein